MKKYKAFGLTISSELNLDELQLSEEDVDVRIIFDKIGEYIEIEAEKYGYCKVLPKKIILYIPKVAGFCITKGELIAVERHEEVDSATLKLFLLGSCMGAILIQRGIIPIHGSAIYYKGKGILIVGDSGAGKSSLASALIEKGAKLLSDDVIPCKLIDDYYYAVPSMPLQKLTEQSLGVKCFKRFTYREVPRKEPIKKKYYIDRNDFYYNNDLKIDYVVNLMLSDSKEVVIREISGIEKLEVLLNNRYRIEFIKDSMMSRKSFEVCARVAAQSKIYILKRPREDYTVEEQIRNIENVINV